MKKNEFTLKIELGNAAMLTEEDVAGALQGVIKRLREGQKAHSVYDLNGNKVGEWSGTFDHEVKEK